MDNGNEVMEMYITVSEVHAKITVQFTKLRGLDNMYLRENMCGRTGTLNYRFYVNEF